MSDESLNALEDLFLQVRLDLENMLPVCTQMQRLLLKGDTQNVAGACVAIRRRTAHIDMLTKQVEAALGPADADAVAEVQP